MISNIKDKILGCLYGQAVGDALGLGTEFMTKTNVLSSYPDGLRRFEQIVRNAYAEMWQPGEWTDDTDMMLCILRSFDGEFFDIDRIVSNFINWLENNPRGIGDYISNVISQEDYIDQPEICSKYEWILSDRESAPNGALMRTSIVGLPKNYSKTQSEAICKLTHFDPRCVGSCVIVTEIIHNLVWNNRSLSYDEIVSLGRKYDDRIEEWINLAYDNSEISALDLDDSKSMGYTLRALSAGLWSYWYAPSFEIGLLTIVNEGSDADTNAAIACSILGAKFGYSSIPDYYVNNLSSN